jgi:CheY-like chemotaxis protein
MKSQPVNVFYVDDDIDDCNLFQEVVNELSLPVDVTVVHDGEQLMKVLKEENCELPHAIFLDLNMPRKNGFECLSEIKKDEDLKHIPIFIVSTSFNGKIVDWLYETGADYSFRKPTDFPQLKKVIYHSLTLISDLPNRQSGNSLQPRKEEFVLNIIDDIKVVGNEISSAS